MQKIKIKFIEQFIPVFADKTKHIILRCGRRCGKTYGAAQKAILASVSRSNHTTLWVDTIQANIKRYIDEYFRSIAGPLFTTIEVDNQRNILTFLNGSKIYFGSAERPENLEGFEYDLVILNEAGIILKKEELWLRSIQPMTKRAQTFFIGTPKGFNFFYELSAKAKSDTDYKEYHFSCYDSPFWDKNELNKLRVTTPANIFKQEYLGEFTTGAEENNLFTPEQLIQVTQPQPQKLNNPQVLAVDVGLKHDRAVWLCHDMVSVWHLEVVNPQATGTISTTDVSAKTDYYLSQYNISSSNCIIDSDGVGAGVVGELTSYYGYNLVEFHSNVPVPTGFVYPDNLKNLSFYSFGNIRCQLAFVLRELIINQQFYIVNNKQLIEELAELRFVNRNGKFYLENKEEMKKRLGKSPDLADALIYSMYPFLYSMNRKGITPLLSR